MIIFGPDIGVLPPEFYLKYGIKKVMQYNLSSYNTFTQQLPLLIPDINAMGGVISDEEKEFDIRYASYVMNSDGAFMELMQIMAPLYEDSATVVFISIASTQYRDIVTESLIKFIQQRYGYNCNIVMCAEDAMAINDNTFSIIGLYTMDKDMMRYVALLGGVPTDEYE